MPWFAALIPAGMAAAGGAAAGVTGGALASGALATGTTLATGAGLSGALLGTGAATSGFSALAAGGGLAGALTGGGAAAAGGLGASSILQLLNAAGGPLASVLSSNQKAGAANAEAKQAQYAARMNEGITRRANQKQIAKAEATAAASGIDVRSGSPLVAILDAVGEAEREALAIRYGGRIKADAAKAQAKIYRGAIPGQIFEGAAGVGKVLSQWWG